MSAQLTQKTERNQSVVDTELTSRQSEVYDENLLDQVRTQWLFGDWDKLTQLKRETIEKHPERAKLAIFVAVGYQQLDDIKRTKEFVQLALEWGGNKRLVSRMLIGGVYNTLGKAAAILQNEAASLKHFAEAVSGISGDKRLSCQARSVHEITRLGLLKQAASLVEKEVNSLSNQVNSSRTNQRINVLRTELDLLHNELSLAQQRNQLATKYSLIGTKHESDNQRDKLKGLEYKSVSQLGQDLWVLEKLNYKRNGFFVEFGATDGVLLSNTYLLEKEFDWRGICAEPNPKLFSKLQNNRKCVCKNTCVAGFDNEEREFILADAYGSLASYEGCDQHKQKRLAYREIGEVIKVTTQTLDSFLRVCNAPQEIDYLSIDTEGSELEILETFDFNYWHIKVLTVEHNFQEEPRKKIRNLLSNYGYQVQDAQWDDWFWRPDLINNAY
ncbi:FkbM family methyltransferase [Methylomonas sp. MgM2]